MSSSHLAKRQVPVRQDISPHVNVDMSTNGDCPQNQWGEKNSVCVWGGAGSRVQAGSQGIREVELEDSEVRSQRPGE